MIELTESKCKINYLKRDQNTFVKNRVGSVDKAEKDIGYKASISLKEGLQQLIEWRKSHQEGLKSRQLNVGII